MKINKEDKKSKYIVNDRRIEEDRQFNKFDFIII